jgi:DNA-nicking Smr family endonuclease
MRHMVKRSLTDEEKKLWQHVARQTKPLRGKNDEEMWGCGDVEKNKITPPRISVTQRPRIPSLPISIILERGAYANIDRNTAEKFRKGKYPIDGTLDLHGMTQGKARAALGAFLLSHYGRGSRCLLVVTGKGIKKNGAEDAPRGVLRESLPVWLNDSDLAPVILTFDTAKQQHGGQGAYYILLRRKR